MSDSLLLYTILHTLFSFCEHNLQQLAAVTSSVAQFIPWVNMKD